MLQFAFKIILNKSSQYDTKRTSLTLVYQHLEEPTHSKSLQKYTFIAKNEQVFHILFPFSPLAYISLVSKVVFLAICSSLALAMVLLFQAKATKHINISCCCIVEHRFHEIWTRTLLSLQCISERRAKIYMLWYVLRIIIIIDAKSGIALKFCVTK